MSIAGRRAQGEDSEDEMQANEDEMEDAFELPDYLDWMDQKEQDQFVREMNKANKNEDDLENMTETDLKDLGIESESTRVKMLDKIRFYFGTYVHSYDGSDGSSDEELQTLALDAVLMEAGNPGKRKATEGGNGKEPEDKGRGKDTSKYANLWVKRT